MLKGSLNIHLENETYHVWVAFSVVFWCLQFQDLSLVLVTSIIATNSVPFKMLNGVKSYSICSEMTQF